MEAERDLEFRVMTLDDMDLCLGLFKVAGWGNTTDDLRRMLNYEPGGCFIASLGGVDVGMVASTGYGDVGWIGNLIVLPDWRGRGIGASLMMKAIRHLEGSGASSIRLDSVQKAIPLYTRLGFREQYWSLRFTGEGREYTTHGVESMTAADLDTITSFDGPLFGPDRGRMLRRVQNDFPDLCFVSRGPSGLEGYIMARVGDGTTRIGPWVCLPGRPEVAEALLEALMMEERGEKLWVGVPEANQASVEILGKHGFVSLPSSLRMCRGTCGPMGDLEATFSIGAPDKG